MDKFLSCDWGTSLFRLKVVKIPGLEIIAEENSDQGIAKTFELWKQTRQAEEFRMSFYIDILQQNIKALQKKSDISLDRSPVIISGMASSTMGLINLPYKEFPFGADGSDLNTKIIEADNDFKHKIIIISGAKTTDDAVRGEETQLAGCYRDIAEEKKQLFIFPGTHSKHVVVKGKEAVAINTYMTGEFFELLSKKSILSVSLEEGNGLQSEKNLQSFQKGINDCLRSNLLHTSFIVRTNHLFGKLSKQENYYYLSGLLIGTEMKELINDDYCSDITLVSNSDLNSYYETAFKILNRDEPILKIENADRATIAGQVKILNRLIRV